ncbi:MAG: ATP synthase F1 subunit epsilon [Coriobacteriales bacterium]|jgi:F-type H+-transporting ATPase subunit epsilon
MSSLQCEIVTPERSLYKDEASFVVVPAETGEIGMYEKHASTIVTLGMGCVRVTEPDGEIMRIAVNGGYAEVDGTKVIVLAAQAQPLSELGKDEVSARIDALDNQISGMSEDDVTLPFNKSQLEWNKLLLKLLEEDSGK